MPTLRQIVRECVSQGGLAVGRSEAITGLAVGSVTCATLGLGGLSEQFFRDHWLCRLDTATAADRFRRCTGFTASSGAMAHTGTNYVDTTTTGETLDILVPEAEPSQLLASIQWALAQLYHLEKTAIPTSLSSRYWLGDFSWLTRRALVRRVTYRNSPILNRNHNFEHYNSVNSSGVLVPDDWTLAGAGGSVARVTTGSQAGYYSAQVTRSTVDVTLTATIGLLRDGANSLASSGLQVSGGIAGTADAASQVRLRISDGVTTADSGYLANGSYDQEEVTAFTIDAAATTLTVQVRVETTDGTPTIDRAFVCIGEASDAVWRDNYSEGLLNPTWHEATAPLSFEVEPRGYGGQYVIHNLRPYPQFDNTRLLAGSGDGDSTDAPAVTIAAGALFHLFDTQSRNLRFNAEKRIELSRLANDWEVKWKLASAAHVHEDSPARGGLPLPRPGFPAPVRRVAGR